MVNKQSKINDDKRNTSKHLATPRHLLMLDIRGKYVSWFGVCEARICLIAGNLTSHGVFQNRVTVFYT